MQFKIIIGNAKMKTQISRLLALSSMFALLLVANSCFTYQHKVGKGPQTGVVAQEKQWFALWGIVPLNKVDSQQLAAGAEDYMITTHHTFLDVVLSSAAFFVTVNCQTVEVTK